MGDGWIEDFADRHPVIRQTPEVLQHLDGPTRAESTERHYRRLYRTFEVYAESIGAVALPAEPQLVFMFISFLAAHGRRAPYILEMSAEPAPAVRYSMASIDSWLSAIRARHVDAGYDSPTDHPRVKQARQRYLILYGRAQRGKDAIGLAELELIVGTMQKRGPWSRRDAALCLLAVHPAYALEQSQLAALQDPIDVYLAPAGTGDPMELWVPGRNGRGVVRVNVHPEPDSHACPVDAMRAWLTIHTPEYVWPTRSGGPLSRQNIVELVATTCRRAGIDHEANTLPRLTAERRSMLGQHLLAGRPHDLRDHALLTNQWATGHRISELRTRTRSEVRVVDLGVEWTINGATKNDRSEPGHVVGALAFPEEPHLCPRLAMVRWLERLELLHGRPLRADDAIFPSMSNNIGLDAALSRSAVARMIKTRSAAAGLEGDYSSHSLRVGMVRDAIDADVPEEHIRRQGRWVSDVVRRYWRRRAVLGRANPAYRVQREMLARRQLGG